VGIEKYNHNALHFSNEWPSGQLGGAGSTANPFAYSTKQASRSWRPSVLVLTCR